MNIAKWSDGPLGTEIRPTWPENRPTLYFLLVIWTFIDRERSERGTSHEGLDSVAHTLLPKFEVMIRSGSWKEVA